MLQALDTATGEVNGETQLLLDHLRFEGSKPIVASVRAMTDSAVEDEVYRFLESTLREQGMAKGKGLQKRIAELFGVSPPTITRISQRVHRGRWDPDV